MSLSAVYPPMNMPLKLDITTGDRITPKDVVYEFKLLLEGRSIQVLEHNLETVMAEKYALKRQLQTKHMAAISAAGTGDSLRYTCFVNQTGVTLLSTDEKRKYVLASLIWNQDPERVLLDLYFDEKEEFYKLIFKRFTSKDVLANEVEELRSQGERIANMRLKKYKLKHPGKIGRNQLCPCGSGKKYKKCCGR